MAVRDTTKRGCQAAIAIAIAELITYIFQLERGYWVAVTAMALTMQTWADSLRRSLERVSMTVLGGCFGTMLYWLIPPNHTLILFILLIFIFFTVYLFPAYHLIGVFCLTGFVVFLFALIGNWDLMLLRERILDTALGAGITILVSRFFLPIKTNIIDIFVNHIEQIQEALNLVFQTDSQTYPIAASHRLYTDFQALRNKALTISYEFLFHRITKRDFYVLMTESAFCTQYVVGLIEAYRWIAPYLTDEDHSRINLAVEATQANLITLKQRLKKEDYGPMLPPTNLMEQFNKAVVNDPKRFASLDNKALGFFNLMYFFTRLNTRLNDIYHLLSKLG
ncbi:Predicted membrane protein [Legionella beliardensis]|uniref:Predicted membrane protein n=1 Tax=Legionella beliardensis TaxID=91822 RepID=A0A378I554_9GAMM|nr:FUSC family protein [Legionella beliardensis]STX29801.1 Predicted membrane protein [Legionella beliardensis]